MGVELPLVTIGVKCLNLEKYVGAAVESAFAQTYRPLEIVISDDGSTDDTWRVVKDVVQAHKGEDIQVVLNRNSSILAIAEIGKRSARWLKASGFLSLMGMISLNLRESSG